MSTPDIVEDAFERGRQLERLRCAKIVCPDCAKGVPINHKFGHVIEWIEGHPYHSRECLAKTILSPDPT
jgi:hypothetical protein